MDRHYTNRDTLACGHNAEYEVWYVNRPGLSGTACTPCAAHAQEQMEAGASGWSWSLVE